MKEAWCYGTYTRLEKKMQETIIYIEKEIIGQNCRQEIELSSVLSNDAMDLVFSFDFGWQQRGSDFTYNSSSGHGFLVGARS